MRVEVVERNIYELGVYVTWWNRYIRFYIVKITFPLLCYGPLLPSNNAQINRTACACTHALSATP